MHKSPQVHIPGDSIVHRLDPRAKIAILAVYCFSLLFVGTWWGMALMAVPFVCALLLGRIPISKVFGCGAVIYVLAAFAVVFNVLRYDGRDVVVSVAGLDSGLLYAARILLLFWMSLLLCFTSTSTGLTEGFSKLLGPLRRFRIPVDDAALVLSLALRFIPITSAEYASVKLAQRARCAHFDDGSLWQRLRAETSVFVPLFVSLFRRADKLASAMDARCYGIAHRDGEPLRRTSLTSLRFGLSDGCALVATVVYCLLVAVLF